MWHACAPNRQHATAQHKRKTEFNKIECSFTPPSTSGTKYVEKRKKIAKTTAAFCCCKSAHEMVFDLENHLIMCNGAMSINYAYNESTNGRSAAQAHIHM